MGARFQGAEVVTIETPLPAVEGLPTDSKMSASACGAAAIEEIKQHPLKPVLGGPATPLPEARQLASLGKVTPSNLWHADTLPSVTNHSERVQCGRDAAKDRKVAGGQA